MAMVPSPSTPLVFTFPDTAQPVRSLMIDAEPWWVARDVADVLELGNMRSSLALLEDDEKGVHTMDTPGGLQQLTLVNEPGLYSLILRSRKKQAKAFKRWVTHEVLPAIRKTGRYEAPVAEPVRIGAATVTWDHAAAVARLHHGLSVDAHGFKELLVTGGILTTRNGIPHRKWEHLFWPSPAGSRWEIHASVLPQLIHFAAKIRRDLALAERDLQMSLPFPIAAIVRDELQGGAA